MQVLISKSFYNACIPLLVFPLMHESIEPPNSETKGFLVRGLSPNENKKVVGQINLPNDFCFSFFSMLSRLFNCNFSACFFELFLNCFCFCFANAFFDNLWSCCNKVFCFFKTKSCKFTYSFDYWYTRTFC